MREAFALISAAIILVAAPPYIIDTIKGKTKPERMTWFIFGMLGVIAFVSQIGLGASWSLVFSGLDTAASILVFGLALKYGAGGYTKNDIFALCVATVGAVTAIIVKEPVVSLFGVLLADLSGSILTLMKTYKEPESETTITWLMVGTASVFGVLAVGKMSFELLLYPIYLM